MDTKCNIIRYNYYNTECIIFYFYADIVVYKTLENKITVYINRCGIIIQIYVSYIITIKTNSNQ